MNNRLETYRYIILYILQVTTLYNAMALGWKVKKIGDNTYELTKKIEDYKEETLESFLKEISNNPHQ